MVRGLRIRMAFEKLICGSAVFGNSWWVCGLLGSRFTCCVFCTTSLALCGP